MVNKYLLDTHTFLWAAKDVDVFRLGNAARDTIEDPDTELFVSSVSIFEISNKYRKGKLSDYKPIAEDYFNAIEKLEARELPLSCDQANLAGALDWPHKDPFDRMLAAQAKSEGMTLITCDKVFADAPDIDILW